MSFYRSSGILIHPTSLPSNDGIGSLGKAAYEWIDWLESAAQRIWQILPFGPTEADGSPYSSISAFAGNPLWIDLEDLHQRSYLSAKALNSYRKLTPDRERVDYKWLNDHKIDILWTAFMGMQEKTEDIAVKLKAFEQEHNFWLPDYAMFRALADINSTLNWVEWSKGVHPQTKQYAGDEYVSKEIANEVARRKAFHIFTQFIFAEQWMGLREYARNKRVKIIGDIPIYVSYKSSDVWANQHLFQLDKYGVPVEVAGVPPDYFSVSGQKWGNPLYDWDAMRIHGFQWWRKRYSHLLKYMDIARIDHFRGIQAYWAIPHAEETAVNGSWRLGPGVDLLNALLEEDPQGSKIPDWESPLSIIAEDLGFITPPVRKVKDALRLPGMAILQFGLEGAQEFLPENIDPNTVAYTGTHDNNTTRGWWDDGVKKGKDLHISALLEHYNSSPSSPVSWQLIELTWRSSARIAIAPMQDILDLDANHRMNIPGSATGNWAWRLNGDLLTLSVANRLKEVSIQSGRSFVSY